MDYHLYDSLSYLYRKQGLFEEAVQSSEKLIEIDRKLQIPERLSHSLCFLAQDLCLLKCYDQAKTVLTESLSTIRSNKLAIDAEKAALEWLAVAHWYLGEFEQSIEKILEHTDLCQKSGESPIKHIVVCEEDVTVPRPYPEFIKQGEAQVHLLVLPPLYGFGNVSKWNEKVIQRRPDLKNANRPTLLTRC